MRILFFAYAQQNSFEVFNSNALTHISWVDELLDELCKIRKHNNCSGCAHK